MEQWSTALGLLAMLVWLSGARCVLVVGFHAFRRGMQLWLMVHGRVDLSADQAISRRHEILRLEPSGAGLL